MGSGIGSIGLYNKRTEIIRQINKLDYAQLRDKENRVIVTIINTE